MSEKNTVEVGQRIQGVEVLAKKDLVDRHGHLRRRVLARFLCGHDELIWTNVLLSRASPNCPMCNRRLNQTVQIGDVYDQLTVTGMEVRTTAPTRKVVQSITWFICRCTCGGLTKKVGQLLLKNQTNHCGCRRRLSWKGVGELSGTFYGRLIAGAKKREIPVSVSIEQLWDLLQAQKFRCALSGLPIVLDKDRDFLKTTASVDRIDSAEGYTVHNVQWVHKEVNLMKNVLAEARFIELCSAVSGHGRGS